MAGLSGTEFLETLPEHILGKPFEFAFNARISFNITIKIMITPLRKISRANPASRARGEEGAFN